MTLLAAAVLPQTILKKAQPLLGVFTNKGFDYTKSVDSSLHFLTTITHTSISFRFIKTGKRLLKRLGKISSVTLDGSRMREQELMKERYK